MTDPDPDPDPNPPLAELIDRIVEGGLTPAQLRLAVGELDLAPDGWRRCALAFLEAQYWSEAFREPGEGESTGPSVIPIPLPARRRWVSSALAAGVSLVAFSLGWLGHSLRSGTFVEPPADAPLLAAASADADEGGGPRASDVSPGLSGSDPVPSLPADRLPTIREVATLRIGTGGSGAAEVPLLGGPGMDPRWLLEQPPPIPEQGRTALQRHGYQLEQQRRLVSIPLGDGRRAAVPIDHVHVRYVGQDPL